MPKRSISWRRPRRAIERQTNRPIAHRSVSRGQKLQATLGLAGKRLGEAQIDQSAAALTYYAILSLFPTALIIINLVPKMGLHFHWLSGVMKQLIPTNVLSTIRPVVRSLANNPSTTWLGIGAVVTLWAASLALASLRTAANNAYGIKNTKQNFLIGRIISMVMMAVLVVGVLGLMIVFAFGRQCIAWLTVKLELSDRWIVTFQALRWPVTISILVVVLFFVFFFLPNAKLHFWTILPGVAFTTAGWIGLSQAFALYMVYFGKGFSTYGALGAFIVLLLWLFFVSAILMIGAVINAVTSEYYYGPASVSRGWLYERVRKIIDRKIANNDAGA